MNHEKELEMALQTEAQRRTAHALKLRHATERAVLALVEQLQPGDELQVEDKLYRVEKVTWLVSRWSNGQQPHMHPVGALTLIRSMPGHTPLVMADVRQDFTDQEQQVIEHVAGEYFFRWEGRLTTATAHPIKLADDQTLVRFSKELARIRRAAAELIHDEANRMEDAAGRVE